MKHKYAFFFLWSTKKKTQRGNIEIYISGEIDVDTTAMDIYIYIFFATFRLIYA